MAWRILQKGRGAGARKPGHAGAFLAILCLGLMSYSSVRQGAPGLSAYGAVRGAGLGRLNTHLNVLAQVQEAKKGGPQNTVLSGSTARPTYDYGGYTEALHALARYPKPAGWNRDVRLCCEALRQGVEASVLHWQQYLTQPDLTDAMTLYLNNVLAVLLMWRGDMQGALGYWDAAYKTSLTNAPQYTAQLEEALGITYLHQAGMKLYDLYVFPAPLSPGAVDQQQRDGLDNAAGYFRRCLKRQPDNLEARWLLNLTHMLAGNYPAAVPKEYLMAPAIFESKEDVGRFRDVARAAGLDSYGEAGGGIVDDFDNDGFLDVMISGMDDCQALRFFHNNGDGTFTNQAAQAGIGNQSGGLNIIHTDYNNDGCKDLLVLRGGWEFPRPKSLLRNNCDGTFTDVTSASGLAASPLTSTQTGVWVDIDNDGNLDLFVGNENAPAQLFLNKGDGTFTDIARSAGVDRITFAKGVVAGDYDNDGYVDLYVSGFKGQHFLYHNNHDRTFSEVSRQAGVGGTAATFASWFFDYDNDGWQDLFVAGYFLSVDDVMRGYLQLPQKGESLQLYKNMGNGTFRDVTAELGLKRVFMPMGLNFGDMDNDGYLDFYLASGNPSYATAIPNVMYHNSEGKKFVDVTASSGTGILAKGHGVAFADIDSDGDEDIFVVMGGTNPSDRHTARLFENPGHGNDWINVHLVGVKSNRLAAGARIKVTVSNEGHGTRSIYRTVSSGGSFGGNPYDQHIGLGKSARIENLEVWWPASNTRQNFSGVEKNQFIEIQELAKDIKKVQRRSFRLGGPKNP